MIEGRYAEETRDILVVEDDPCLRELMTRVLREEGYNVEEAGDGTSALLAFERAPFDLLLTDWQIPGMSGIALAAEARRRRPGIAVLLSSGSPGMAADEQRRASCDDELLAKPFAVSELVGRVSGVLRAPRRLRGGEALAA